MTSPYVTVLAGSPVRVADQYPWPEEDATSESTPPRIAPTAGV